MPPAKSNAVVRPNKGLFLDRAALNVPNGGLSAGENFRIQNGALSNLNLGWVKFPDDASGIVLSASTRSGITASPCTLVGNFLLRSGSQKLLFGTP